MSLHGGRHPAPSKLPSDRTSAIRSMRCLGARPQPPLRIPNVNRPQARRQQLAFNNRHTRTQQVMREVQMSCETLQHLRHLSRPGDYFVSLYLVDCYYTLGIREDTMAAGRPVGIASVLLQPPLVSMR
jgi:hypothetical protein